MKTINQLNNQDKPREKLLKKGIQVLKDCELVAIILGNGYFSMNDEDML